MKGGEPDEKDRDQKDQDHQGNPTAFRGIFWGQANQLQVIATSGVKPKCLTPLFYPTALQVHEYFFGDCLNSLPNEAR